MQEFDRIARPAEAAKIVGCARSTLYEWEKLPDFPTRLRLGRRASGWRVSELNAWLATRPVAGPDVGPGRAVG